MSMRLIVQLIGILLIVTGVWLMACIRNHDKHPIQKYPIERFENKSHGGWSEIIALIRRKLIGVFNQGIWKNIATTRRITLRGHSTFIDPLNMNGIHVQRVNERCGSGRDCVKNTDDRLLTRFLSFVSDQRLCVVAGWGLVLGELSGLRWLQVDEPTLTVRFDTERSEIIAEFRVHSDHLIHSGGNVWWTIDGVNVECSSNELNIKKYHRALPTINAESVEMWMRVVVPVTIGRTIVVRFSESQTTYRDLRVGHFDFKSRFFDALSGLNQQINNVAGPLICNVLPRNLLQQIGNITLPNLFG